MPPITRPTSCGGGLTCEDLAESASLEDTFPTCEGEYSLSVQQIIEAVGLLNGGAIEGGDLLLFIDGLTGEAQVADFNALAAAIIATSVVATYSTTIGDGGSTDIVVTHNLGTTDVIVSGVDLSTTPDTHCDLEWEPTDANSITIRFPLHAPPALNSVRITVMG